MYTLQHKTVLECHIARPVSTTHRMRTFGTMDFALPLSLFLAVDTGLQHIASIFAH
jgi:hypothetical protein